jgi:hypothetical protein
MELKIQKLSELEQVLSNKEKIGSGVIDFITNFKFEVILKPFDSIKCKGFKVSMLIAMLCLYRIRGLSIWAMQKTGSNGIFNGDENCFYRLLNNSMMDWRKLLLNIALQFKKITSSKGDGCNKVKCFIIDDSDLEKTGSTIEFISRIFNHVTRTYILGFKLLTLAYWDGKSLVPADFSLHREKGQKGNYGLSKKEIRSQFRKKRDKKTPSYSRVQELEMKKTEVAVSMLKRAVRKGLEASYVLMDSWFTNDYMIRSIRAIKNGMIHLLGMCKIDKRKYTISGKELNSHQIIICNERKRGKYSRKHKSLYIPLVVDYKGAKVKLFYIKYHKSKDWTLLLTTDLSLKFTQAIEIYQIRWTIEVFFKECKQYLRLGLCQNTDFNGQIADTTLTFITYTVLNLQRRFEAYETIGELFRVSQQYLMELTLWERILEIFIKMLQQLMEVLPIDLEETLEKLFHDHKRGKKLLAIMNALSEDDENHEKTIKIAA